MNSENLHPLDQIWPYHPFQQSQGTLIGRKISVKIFSQGAWAFSVLRECDGLLSEVWITLEYRIVVGLRLLINQNFFENVDEEKIKKWQQCLDWCKNVLKSWCEN